MHTPHHSPVMMLPAVSAVRCVRPAIACISGSLLLGCALQTLFSAFFPPHVAPGLQLETAARLAAFSTRMWLAQLGINSVDIERTTWPLVTDAALAACSHMLSKRLSSHAERLLSSPHRDFPGGHADLGPLLFSFAIHLVIGACILIGRYRSRGISMRGGMDPDWRIALRVS
ncbi:hypothetical protein AURDEDRAFT_165557 [Auricularia subglabra TFB-10046 SS5]|nr:hypothetical protein AURDEDRAFT_165557 [Auricularia subglabra TFB-10046 SS5]